VLLGGGYGRGEGGVLRGPAGDRPYNDLEFDVAIKGNRHLNAFRYHRRLEVLGEILSHLADVEVEFKITSLARLAAQPPSTRAEPDSSQTVTTSAAVMPAWKSPAMAWR